MLNKAMHKTRLTQNTQVMQKQKQEGEKEKVTESRGVLFFPHLGRTFPFSKPLIRQWVGRILTIQIWKKQEGFEKIS